MRLLHILRRFGSSAAAAFLIPWLSFFLPELFIYTYTDTSAFSLAFSAMWAGILAGFLFLLPRLPARILFVLLYYPAATLAILQAGYFELFGKFMWLTYLVYLRDGAEFAGSVFDYLPAGFVPAAVLLLLWGAAACRLRPNTTASRAKVLAVCFCAVTAAAALPYLLNAACAGDELERGLGTDYYAGKSLRRAYDLMYDAHKVYTMCGLYHSAGRDIWVHLLEPQLPGNKSEENQKLARIESYFAQRESATENEMTGTLAGKNVILVLMESADDWTIREDTTPTLCRLMREGINFTNLYTPLYGSVRTFNTEFTVNTGVFSPTDGSLTFTYCGNDYSESLPNTFRAAGYSANAFHYNSPSFYSRGVMDPAMGYETYICYADYAEHSNQFSSELYEDTFVLTNPDLRAQLLPDKPFFNFVISRNAHMPYSSDDSVSKYAMEQYPQYADADECEEVGYYLAKMKLLDNFFSQLLAELERAGQLENTVIVGVTDHYSYSMKDQERVRALSDVPVDLMVEKTPFFIWSTDLQPMTVDKTLNTSDIAPTLLNLFCLSSGTYYIGHDAFDPNYAGYAIFSDGSWIDGNVVYQDGEIIHEFSDGAAARTDIATMNQTAQDFIEINNLILETDYYSK